MSDIVDIRNTTNIGKVKLVMLKGEAGQNIRSIEKVDTDVLVDTYAITLTDGTTTYFEVTNGKGIVSITKTGTSGLVDTYTITFNDNTTSTFTVTNGNGIASVIKTGTNVLVDTYTITFDDETTTTFNVTNGNGISSIEKTGTQGLIDTYTITFTNGTTSTFTVTNGTSSYLDRTFNVASTDWKANTDATTATDYPYIWDLNTPPTASYPDYPIYQNENSFAQFSKVFDLLKDNQVDISNRPYLITISEQTQDGVTYYSGYVLIKTDNNPIDAEINANDEPTFKVTATANTYIAYEYYLYFSTSEFTLRNITGQGDFTAVGLVSSKYDNTVGFISNHDINDSTNNVLVIEYNPTANIYNANSKPIWQMGGVGTIPTATERDSINMILEAIFDSTGIILYATDQPTVNLKLEVKGD